MNRLASALRRSVDEPEDFELIFSDQFDPMLNRLVRRVLDPEVAVEIAAESIAEAFSQRRKFRGRTDAEVVGWLNGIADRKLARYFRKAKTERRALHRLGLEPPAMTEEEHAALLERADVARQQREWIRAGLRDLSDAQRDVLRLRIVDELPYASVAERLGITEPAARARALKVLQGVAVSRQLEEI